MRVDRMQVEEGFLAGFDLRLSPGLNVIIGARGTGKTSVIELLRFALGAKNHTSEAEVNSLSHARAILQGGEVTVELTSDDGERVIVSRTADSVGPHATAAFAPPVVLSQTEIETVGLSKAGRLALIDGFVGDRSSLAAVEARLVSSLRSAFKEISALDLEIARTTEGQPAKEALLPQIAALEKEQKKLEMGSGISAVNQQRLQELAASIGTVAVQEDAVNVFIRTAGNWFTALEELQNEQPGADTWAEDSADPLSVARVMYVQALEEIKRARASLMHAWGVAQTARAGLGTKRAELEKQARTIRTEIEAHAQGSGAVARQLVTVKTQLAQAEAREKTVAERRSRLTKLRRTRDVLLDELAETREKRYQARADVVRRINLALGPHINVEVQRSSDYEEYKQAVTNGMRGSGMRYGDLANRVAEHVSPRELLCYVESESSAELAQLLDVPHDRAARLAGHLREQGMADIVTSLVEDDVRMSLLDGVGYKDISALSAGQRCTVILSMVLQHTDRTLIIDQPEDHLDNAFVASTVIRALRERDSASQVILSTHNANIPVLGNADLIVQLSSDGRNGFVQLQKPLDDPEAVEAISTVMEGGRQAFEQRATFYRRNSR